MTSPATFAPPAADTRQGPPRRPSRDTLAARRTLIALLASALGVLPLKSLFSDDGWLIDVWLTMLVVVGPAALIRLRRSPGALDVWPGIILLVPWLTLRFAGTHAFGRILPTTGTWHDLGSLMNSLHHTTRYDSAPIHTTVAVRLVICALLGLLAALIDLIAVVGRRGALAGVPLLIVYTVAGAVPRQPVSWVWFVFAAIAYLVLLAVDSGDELRGWGVRVATPGTGRARTALAVSTQRIAVAAIVVAVLLPLIVPGQSRNLIANAFHNSGGGGSGIGGFGEGSGTAGISPFAALQGQLQRTTPVPLLTVHMSTTADTQPFYLRVNVLSKYSASGWSLDDHGTTQPLNSTNFDTEPLQGGASDSTELEARIDITGLSGNAPIFTIPTSIEGVDPSTTWSAQDQLILGSKVSRGQQIIERFSQLTPTQNQLNATGAVSDTSLDSLLQIPGGLPPYARTIVDRLTAGKTTLYQKARAISDFFADPANHFTYDVQTRQGDSSSALDNFLHNRVGYCQQYAAAMGVMLRGAGIPARVVLGYEHPVPDANGNFTVTTADAHAWVEAYFSGIGWVPFDPTPTSGLVGGQRNDLGYAPHAYPTSKAGGVKGSVASRSQAPLNGNKRPLTQPSAGPRTKPQAAAAARSASWPYWPLVIVAVLIALLLVPAATRMVRRRRRYAAARRGDPDALWAELSDTALDLGYVWSAARSPRQVAQWLSGETASSAAALQSLAVAVEHRRYSPDAAPADGAELARQLQQVTGQLRSRRGGRTRLRAWLLPPSLRWGSAARVRLDGLRRH